MFHFLKLSSRNIALVAVFSALYYVLSLVSPRLPSIGVPELRIALEALIASVFGIILGPYLGSFSALLGAFVTWILPPSGMNPVGAPFLLSPPLNALMVGLIFYRKWKYAFATLSALIVVFIFLPPSQPIAQYYYVSIAVLWDKIIALMLIIPAVLLSRRFAMADTGRLWTLFFLICFIGNQSDNMWGANAFALPIVYEGIFGMQLEWVRDAFVVSPFVYPAIRFVQALVGTTIAVPLYMAVKNTKWLTREKPIIEQRGIRQ